MKPLPGFSWDAKRKKAVLDGYVAGSNGRVRRQRTLKNVTRDQALAKWKAFRADLESGRAIEGPLTLRQFVGRYYDVIAASHTPGTRKTQSAIIKNHLLRYFGDTEIESITTVRVVDFMADMRTRSCSPSYINDAARVLKYLLRQAVERDVIADYPIKKRVPKERETPLRLELKPEERVRFFSAFKDEDAFRHHLDAAGKKGPVRASDHFASERRFGGGMRGDSEAAGSYFARFRELRPFFVVAVETGLRMWSDLRDLKWSSIDLTGGFIRVLMQKTQREAEIPISSACRGALQECLARPVAGVYVFVDNALFFNFQRQDEIANRRLLFDRQGEEFVPQAIKDTLPYFLGAITDDRLSKRAQLRTLRLQVREAERDLADMVIEDQARAERARRLAAEAEEIGLLEPQPKNATIETLLAILRATQQWTPTAAAQSRVAGQALARLQADRKNLTREFRIAKEELDLARTYAQEQGGFKREAYEQRTRLASVGLFMTGSNDTPSNTTCPLCDSHLELGVPSVDALNAAMRAVAAQLDGVEREQPRLGTIIDEREKRVASLSEQVTENQRQSEHILEQNAQLNEEMSLDARRARVVGRISLFLEGIRTSSQRAKAEKKLAALLEQLAKLDEELSGDTVRDRLDIRIIGDTMSEWSKRLLLEHSTHPLRIDVSRLNVVADTDTGPVPLDRMGGGENWVGYHLVAHLALHRWFVDHKRPIPRFLILDQPTQVYYPPEQDSDPELEGLKDDDKQAVARMFELLFDVTKSLAPDLQVIVLDHADLRDSTFRDAVVERWRNGPKKLIPQSWYSSNASST